MTTPKEPPAAEPPNPKQTWSEEPPFRRFVFWLMLPGIVIPILIFGFIIVTHAAHDESRCPFEERSVRELAAGVRVHEEARSCIAGVEEHRFRLERAGHLRFLGSRRFHPQAFAGDYGWSARISEQGEVQITVHNPGYPDATFREGTAEEHEWDRRNGGNPDG